MPWFHKYISKKLIITVYDLNTYMACTKSVSICQCTVMRQAWAG